MNNYRIFRSVYGIVFLLGLIVPAFGIGSPSESTRTEPERGFKPGNSYAISDIENIALYSGELSLSLPLGSLPPGRGGLSAAINLLYSSKVWKTLNDLVLESPVTEHDLKTLLKSDNGGWRYGYKYKLELESRLVGLNNYYCDGSSQDTAHPYRLVLVFPDGGRHPLHLTPYTDADGYMTVWPDGRRACTGAGSNPSQDLTGTLTYFTTDGTYLRVDVVTDSDSDWTNNQWTVSMPDGSQVIGNPGGGVAQRIKDRNGNYLDIIENASDSGYSGHRTTYLQDQMNRKVVIEYEADTDEDRIHSKGFDGADIVTRVAWKTIRVNQSYYVCDYNPPGNPADYHDYPLDQELEVVDRIYLPTQVSGSLYYQFDYNADSTSGTDTGWGELSKVTLPSGASAEYDYYYDDPSGNPWADEIILNRVKEKRLVYNTDYDGTSSEVTETTKYDIATQFQTGVLTENIDSVTVLSPDGSARTEYYARPSDSQVSSPSIPDYLDREVYKSEGPDGSVVEKYMQSNIPSDPNYLGLNEANRYAKYEFVSPKDASGNFTQTAITEYKRDKNGNVAEIREYDFVAYSSVPRNSLGRPYALPSGATPARITKTEYYNDTPDAASTTYTDAHSYHLAGSPSLRNAASSAEVQTGAGTPRSRTELFYDNYSTTGNVTQTKTWDSFKGGSAQAYSDPLTGSNSISTSATYDSYGNPLTQTDANGTVTQLTYGSIGGYSGLYPTQVKTAYGLSVQRTGTFEYDLDSGLKTLTTDVDNSVSSGTDYDDLGRPVKAIAAVGTASEYWTRTEYDDEERIVVTRSDLSVKGDGKIVGIRHFDELGRVRLSRSLEDSGDEDPYDEEDGIKVQTRYRFDDPSDPGSSNGTYILTSNPYRAATSSGAGSEETMGWTLGYSDKTGRLSATESFSGAALPAPFVTSGANTASTGVVTTNIDANRTLVTDQAGKQRISKTNALGHLTDVWEITPQDSETVSVSFPNQSGITHGYRTSYEYDELNNLTEVDQGVQTRTFAYSSLSRLLSAENPESGTISYGYDAAGNLTSKTDARNITTTYVYDAQNRITSRSYSDSITPAVSYTYYDPSISNSKGGLTKVSSSVSETRYTKFDLLGRIEESEQRTPVGSETISTAPARVSKYKYNLSGAVIEQAYPSGRVVKNTLDSIGRLSMVQASKNASSGLWTYAGSFTFNAAGSVTRMQLGNGAWEGTAFNSRMQPTGVALGSTPGASNLLNLAYTYNTKDGSADNPDNNGNVLTQTIIVDDVGANPGFDAVQTYTYDPLNRIKTAEEVIDESSPVAWTQEFTYDRYGNRNINESTTTTLTNKTCGTYPNYVQCAAEKEKENPEIDKDTNRIEELQPDGDQDEDYDFDAAGNMTLDPDGRQFFYDGENKQIKVEDISENIIGEYVYDGDGRRVMKKVPLGGGIVETTVFVYNAGGKLVAEYSTTVASQSTAQVSYLTNDHLGSPRITTDKNGKVYSRRDFLPFGEDLDINVTAERTSAIGYGPDSVRQKFTGYERDDETELEYAQARMFNASIGRFPSVDPSRLSIDSKNPATWNRYIYVLNNPLKLIDENGKWPTTTHRKIIEYALTGMAKRFTEAVVKGSNETDVDGLNCRTCWEKNAPQHAMTRGGDVRGYGENRARGYARSEATAFVDGNLKEAKRLFEESKQFKAGSKEGIQKVEEALEKFGAAMHTVMDHGSPAHNDFQVYDIYKMVGKGATAPVGPGITGTVIGMAVGTAQEIAVHNTIEGREPTPEEYEAMADQIRVYFERTFGKEAYNSSVKAQDRQDTSRRQEEGRVKIGFY